MRQHRLAFCAAHFPAWVVKQTSRTIRSHRMFGHSERVLVAVSGGKDSLALWDVLLELGYQADGLYIDLGIDAGDAYSATSRHKAAAFAAARPDTRLIIVDIAACYGETLAEVARRKRDIQRPCAICGLIKRHEMNRVTLEEGYPVLATGHNLDDEAATLLGNVLYWQSGYLRRQWPVLPADETGLARKVKPFHRFYERETAAYALIRGIDYIHAECPHAVGASSIAHKQTLNQMEHAKPGTKMQFYINFLRAKKEGLFVPFEDEQITLNTCAQCGQSTTAEARCTFCRLWEV